MFGIRPFATGLRNDGGLGVSLASCVGGLITLVLSVVVPPAIDAGIAPMLLYWKDGAGKLVNPSR
jgi:hypothetical protein